MDRGCETAAALGRGIAAGDLDPVALAEDYLDRIATHPMASRIYARTTPDRALAEAGAARARARAGRRLSPLDGVPVSWKDLFDTAGTATEAGSALLAGRMPARDAAVLRNMVAAGTICLGKTHLSELAFSGLGYNPVTATAPCVHDPDRVAGGSSSGAAASVAFGLAPAAVGSDTGGSVRIPAVWNDLVGLKTSAGSLPMAGVVPLAPFFDTIGPLTRNVEDAALIWAALGGRAAPDLADARLAGARLLVLADAEAGALAAEVRTGFARALDAFAAAGATLVRAERPEVAAAMALAPVLFAAEAYAQWRDALESAPGKVFPLILDRFRGGRDTTGTDYAAARARLAGLRAEWRAGTAGYDAVLVPTCPVLPPLIADLAADDGYYIDINLRTLSLTRIGNLMGLCALTLPTGVPMTGAMLMAPPGAEARLLRLGAAAEAALAA
jgi:aspartyl-tRNA(Asn)/glutamyl-tRNA(Gln) amidotransferase subunit A